MTSRERLRKALNHHSTGRPPIDFGATAVTGMRVSVVAAMRERYGLRQRPVKVVEPYQMLGEIDAEVAAATGRGVIANFGGTAFGDVALVPAPFLKHPKGIRDIAEWYVSTAARQDYVHAIFARQLDFALANLAKIHCRELHLSATGGRGNMTGELGAAFEFGRKGEW